MTRSIAFHSYKGGTGKSTIAANLASKLAAEGSNVVLLDMDVYAPSLHVYFDHNPTKWINDLLTDKANISEVIVDMSSLVEKIATKSDKIGKLWVGYSNPQKEEIYKLEGSLGGKQRDTNIQLLRRFIKLHDDLCNDYDCDYILIDTSPGVRYWSINSLAVADLILLTLKFGDLDIEGTRRMAAEVHEAFKRHGTDANLLLNRVAGYCVPHVATSTEGQLNKVETVTLPYSEGSEVGSELSKDLGMNLIAALPCYCDIQFSRKEFLTALQHPLHPFAKQIHMLAEQVKGE